MITASKKIVNAWAMYDWANSAYSLIITSAIFPAYYSAIAPEQVNLLGRTYERSALASYSISFSFLIIAILSPILSSIADFKGNKKSFMKFFCYLGSTACCSMVFFTNENIGFGIFCSIIASIGFCGSIVFYNSYLPEIAAPQDQDKISAKGFVLGYIGSVLLMVICLAFIMGNDAFKMGWGSWPARLSFLAVGLWWAGFAQIAFKYLPKGEITKATTDHNIFFYGFQEFKKVWQQLQQMPQLRKFLFSFFFYNMGVQTVMYLATYFAADELHMQSAQLIITVLIIQIVAIFGANLFSFLSKKTSNTQALITIIFMWIGICVYAYFTKTVNDFYILALCVGCVMGGIQSLSRSTYSKLLPNTKDTASFFSFYDVCDKMGTVLGTLAFGMVGEFLGGMRNSVLSLILFFIIGLLGLFSLKKYTPLAQ
jgi:MFS transporter, UMF1 family